MNLRCSSAARTGVITPKAILLPSGQSRAASTAGIALGITVECLPLNFAPFRRPFSWLTIYLTVWAACYNCPTHACHGHSGDPRHPSSPLSHVVGGPH